MKFSALVQSISEKAKLTLSSKRPPVESATVSGTEYARRCEDGVEAEGGVVTFNEDSSGWVDFGTVTHRIFDPPLYLLLYPERSKNQDEWPEPYKFELYPSEGFRVGHLLVETERLGMTNRFGKWEVVSSAGFVFSSSTETVNCHPKDVIHIDLEFDCKVARWGAGDD